MKMLLHPFFIIFMKQDAQKKGLEIFGKHGKEAVQREIMQLHMPNTFRPLDTSKLVKEERMKATTLLMFLKKKQGGSNKS